MSTDGSTANTLTNRSSHNPQAFNMLKSKLPCKVCGADGRGETYGSYACIGCAEFFKRNRGRTDFLCVAKTEQCEITVDTRNKCQACRLKKCLRVGMIAPKNERNLCKICGEPSSGATWGVPRCKGCGDFFGKLKRENTDLKCLVGGNCKITFETRARCAACRFKKCVLAGMKGTRASLPNAVEPQTYDLPSKKVSSGVPQDVSTDFSVTTANTTSSPSLYQIAYGVNGPVFDRPSAWQFCSYKIGLDFEKSRILVSHKDFPSLSATMTPNNF